MTIIICLQVVIMLVLLHFSGASLKNSILKFAEKVYLSHKRGSDKLGTLLMAFGSSILSNKADIVINFNYSEIEKALTVIICGIILTVYGYILIGGEK